MRQHRHFGHPPAELRVEVDDLSRAIDAAKLTLGQIDQVAVIVVLDEAKRLGLASASVVVPRDLLWVMHVLEHLRLSA
jgi:hypothetical protein